LLVVTWRPADTRQIGGVAECVNAAGELRTLPCCLWSDDPRQSGLYGFSAARLIKSA
jgi:16S rRNA (cytosine967-C5)-methyltransferase